MLRRFIFEEKEIVYFCVIFMLFLVKTDDIMGAEWSERKRSEWFGVPLVCLKFLHQFDCSITKNGL